MYGKIKSILRERGSEFTKDKKSTARRAFSVIPIKYLQKFSSRQQEKIWDKTNMVPRMQSIYKYMIKRN
jgi:hypothetical protein